MMGLYCICVLTLSCSVPIESKSLCAEDHVNGHTNPTFLLKKKDSDHLVKTPMMTDTVL